MFNMWFIICTIALTTYLCTNKRYRWFYVLYKTYKRDLRGAIAVVQVSLKIWFLEKQNQTVSKLFTSVAQNYPHKPAFLCEDAVWTYDEVEKFSNQIARYFEQNGFRKGQVIALLLDNGPEYPTIWLGLSKIGVITALINTNLVNESLLHSINVSNSEAVIFGSNYSAAITNIMEHLKFKKLYQLNKNGESIEPNSTFINLRTEIREIPSNALKTNLNASCKDPLIYIYTSGTTGLPKAAPITHLRYMFMATALHYMLKILPNDVIYVPLPVYHSAGGILGMGQSLIFGNTAVIRKKFSASNYWKDCVKYKCTIAQYIGEMCRYILTSQDEFKEHPVRAIAGNGLQQQIWSNFKEKFGIKEIYEFYGSTEGISNLVNFDGTVGSVGFVPRYLKPFYPVTLIRCNTFTGEPIRNNEGLCIECDVNEPGLAVAKINPKRSLFDFKGYSNNNETQKKILKNVFANNDTYFNSGDILIYDELGYFYFKDRTGDTFRWKGENVSTAEVESVISKLIQFRDIIVYGVEIHGTEGRAGMAAIVDSKKTLDIDQLSKDVQKCLPSYSIPIFLRIIESAPITGTYKLKKVELRAEGYNPKEISDNLYLFDFKLKKYVNLTNDLYKKILSKDIKM